MFKISNRKIGKNHPVFIIAEMSANHMQNFDIAVEIIKKAKWAGADAIKFQTFTPDTMTINCNNKYFQIKQDTIWDGQTLYELYKEAYMPWEWQEKLKKVAINEGLIWLSTPGDKTAVDFLESLDIPAYKIASFEITDIPLIEYVASKGKPIILSTGIAELPDINTAIYTCKKMRNSQIALLKCVSSYPTLLKEVDLKMISEFKRRFEIIVGLSDHTLGISIPIASVALGACIIEKHLCLDRKSNSLDSAFSLEPAEFKEMVKSVRGVEKALGKVTWGITDKTKKNRELSRSLFVVKDIKKGEIFTEENIRSIRPGFGILPKYLNYVLGKKAKINIKRGMPVWWENIVE